MENEFLFFLIQEMLPKSLKNIQSSCGCKVHKKPKGRIASGESSKIIIRYYTNRRGPFRKTIIITTNVKVNPILALKIKGSINISTKVISGY